MNHFIYITSLLNLEMSARYSFFFVVCLFVCLNGIITYFRSCTVILAEPTDSEKDLTTIKVSLLERNRNPHISSHLPLTPSSVFFSGIVGDIEKNNRTKTADKPEVINFPFFALQRAIFGFLLSS